MTPFPNGTGPANADTGPPAPHAAAGTGGTSAIGGAHGRPCLSGAAFRRFTLPALLGLGCAGFFLLVLGADNFLLPALCTTVAVLLLARPVLNREKEAA